MEKIIGCCALIVIGLAIIGYTLFRRPSIRPSAAAEEEGETLTPEQIAAAEAAEDFKD